MAENGVVKASHGLPGVTTGTGDRDELTAFSGSLVSISSPLARVGYSVGPFLFCFVLIPSSLSPNKNQTPCCPNLAWGYYAKHWPGLSSPCVISELHLRMKSGQPTLWICAWTCVWQGTRYISNMGVGSFCPSAIFLCGRERTVLISSYRG